LKRGDLGVVAAHCASRKRVPDHVVDAAVAARGKPLYEEGNPANGVPNCVGCHGPSGGDSPLYPRLAGQISSYTIQQMSEFKSGFRTNDRARVMREIASRMTDDEIRAVAEYIAGLSP
jgi:cytochrome c553